MFVDLRGSGRLDDSAVSILSKSQIEPLFLKKDGSVLLGSIASKVSSECSVEHSAERSSDHYKSREGSKLNKKSPKIGPSGFSGDILEASRLQA